MSAAASEGYIRLLAFGDSLTAGYTKGGREMHPYTWALKENLEASIPRLDVRINLQGVGGDRVTSPPGHMYPRMDHLFQESPEPYNYTIILGGTNDLATNLLPDDIFSVLQSLWDIPLSHGSRVLALTVPESGNFSPIHHQRRIELNELILGHKEENFYILDLCSKVPFFGAPDKWRKQIWDDGTHFTPAGYDLIGELIAERLTEIITFEAISEGEEQDRKKIELKRDFSRLGNHKDMKTEM